MRARTAVGLVAPVLVAACLAAAPCVRAQDLDEAEARDAEARNLFEAGRLAMADGRYEEALAHFRRAHALSGRPELSYNVGVAAERLRDHATAVEAFEAYLRDHPEAPNRADVERRIELEREALREEQARQAASTDEVLWNDSGPRDVTAPVTSEWWFWTLVGVGALAVAGAVVAIVLATSSDPGVQEPLPGRDGFVIQALSF